MGRHASQGLGTVAIFSQLADPQFAGRSSVFGHSRDLAAQGHGAGVVGHGVAQFAQLAAQLHALQAHGCFYVLELLLQRIGALSVNRQHLFFGGGCLNLAFHFGNFGQLLAVG